MWGILIGSITLLITTFNIIIYVKTKNNLSLLSEELDENILVYNNNEQVKEDIIKVSNENEIILMELRMDVSNIIEDCILIEKNIGCFFEKYRYEIEGLDAEKQESLISRVRARREAYETFFLNSFEIDYYEWKKGLDTIKGTFSLN